jgi:hypothetical protein
MPFGVARENQSSVLKVAKCLPTADRPTIKPYGGRTWWAHFEFTRINIEPTIPRKKIEDLREVGAPRSVRRVRAPSLSCLDRLGAHGFRPTSFDTDSGSLRPSRLGCHPDDIRGARICIRRQR